MTPPDDLPYLRIGPGGVELDVLVQPRASRSRLVGLQGDRLKVQLAAPPVDGEANEALLKLMAEHFAVARRQVSLRRGEASRRKTVAIDGVDEGTARRRLGEGS